MAKLRPLRYPARLEARYRRWLLVYVKDMRIQPRVVTSDPRWRQDGLAEDMAELLKSVQRRFRAIWPERRIRAFAEDLFRRVNAQNGRQFITQWGSELRPNIPSVAPTNDMGLQEAFVERNVGLIRSIDARYFSEIEGLVMDAIANGTRVEQLSRDIRARYGVSQSRARLIARDQVGKVVGQLTRRRQQAAGVEQAQWSTSQDERVRKTHREVNGRVYDLDGPGVLVGGKRLFPGQDYQCRCSSIPVLPEFDAPVEDD